MVLAALGSMQAQNCGSKACDSKQHGKVIVRLFGETGVDLKHYDGLKTGINRAYLGYQYKFNHDLSAKFLMDFAGGHKNGKYEAFVKNAFLSYTPGQFSLSAGMIGTFQFDTQESYWGHRYIEKSIMDKEKMGSSADLGIKASYMFNDFLKGNIAIINGLGYKNVTTSKYMKYALGFNITPTSNLILKVYGDYRDRNEAEFKESKDPVKLKGQFTASVFAGYKANSLTVGLEYDRQNNHHYIDGADMNAVSGYANYKFNPKWSVFGRVDYTSLDESKKVYALGGVQFNPIKAISLSSNLRYTSIKDGDDDLGLFINVDVNI